MLDFRRVTRGERIAGIAGISLLLIMIMANWYRATGVSTVPMLDGLSPPIPNPQNAVQSFTFVDLFLFATVLAAVCLPLLTGGEACARSPAAPGAFIATLGLVASALLLIKIVYPPDLMVNGVRLSRLPGAGVARGVGPWLGLLATAIIAYGGGSSFRAGYKTNGPGSS